MTISIKLTFQSGRESLHSVVIANSDIERVSKTQEAVEEVEKTTNTTNVKVDKEAKDG